MTASEMFERLGFTRNLNSGKLIYTKNLKGMFRYLDITFDLTAKEIELYDDREAYTVSNALLKAIDKQAEELGWPDEKPTYKLSQFEYDLINAFDRCKECCLLNEIECLKKLIEKGYFKGIDPFTKVHDIIDNCEVVG